MGEDVIYTHKKMLPRFFVVFAICVTLMFASWFVSISSPSFPYWSFVFFVPMFLYILIEFLHARALVRGKIGGVRIVDLTRAVYWLSIIASGRAPSNEFLPYYKNVNESANKIGGELQSGWERIRSKHGIVNLEGGLLLGGVFACLLASVLGMSLKIDAIEQGFLLLAIGLLVFFSVRFKKSRDSVESIVKDKEVVDLCRKLTQNLLLWVGERSVMPLRMMLAESDYSGVAIVDSTWGVHIVEVTSDSYQKLSVETSAREHGERAQAEFRASEFERQQKWEPIWLALLLVAITASIVLLQSSLPLLAWIYELSPGTAGGIIAWLTGLVIMSSPFVPVELFFRKRQLQSSFFVLVFLVMIFLGLPTLEWLGFSEKLVWFTFETSVIVISTIAFVILLYFSFPILKIMFRGGEVQPSDMEQLVKRMPARSLRKYMAKDDESRQRLQFIINLHRTKSVKLKEISELEKRWVLDDSKRPEKLRYFHVEQEQVSLSVMGEILARVLLKKLGNT
jgi:hypothetical protein